MIESTYVYALRAGSVVKVGLSSDPVRRVREIQATQRPTLWRLKECASRDEARLVEEKLHAQLAPWRTHGEWFRFCDASQRIIEASLRSVPLSIDFPGVQVGGA